MNLSGLAGCEGVQIFSTFRLAAPATTRPARARKAKMKTTESNKNAKMTEAQFRALCTKYGSPDDVPCSLMPPLVASGLSMADRFFDDPESINEAVQLLKDNGVLAGGDFDTLAKLKAAL